MGVIDCLNTKLLAQNPTFEDLSKLDPAIRRRVLQAKEGYVSKKRIDALEKEINKHIESGKFEAGDVNDQAARYAIEVLQDRITQRTANLAATRVKARELKTLYDDFVSKGGTPLEAIKETSIRFDDTINATLLRYRNAAKTMFAESWEASRRGFFPNKEKEERLVQGLFNLSKGEAIDKSLSASEKQAVKEFYDLTMRIPKEYNDLGSFVKARSDHFFGFHGPDNRILATLSQDEFVRDFMDSGVNWARIAWHTGKNLLDESDRLNFAKFLYDTQITGRPLGEWQLFKSNNMSSAVNRMQAHRLITFDDPMKWLQFHRKYHAGTLHEMVDKYISSRARDFAKLSVYGPSPGSSISALIKHINRRNSAKDAKKLTDKAITYAKRDVSPPRMEYSKLAQIAADVPSNFLQSAVGGTIAVTSALEPFMASFAAASRGLPWFNGMVRSFVGYASLNQKRAARAAAEMGYQTNYYSSMVNWIFRDLFDSLPVAISKGSASLSYKAFAVHRLTNAAVTARQFDMGFQFAKWLSNPKKYADELSILKKRYGLNDDELKALVPSIDKYGNTPILNLDKIAQSGTKKDIELYNKMSRISLDYKGFTAPERNPLWAGAVSEFRSGGNVQYVLGRWGSTFTGYLFGSIQRLMKPLITGKGPVTATALMGTFFALQAFLGYWTSVLQDITNYKDPKPIDHPESLLKMAGSVAFGRQIAGISQALYTGQDPLKALVPVYGPVGDVFSSTAKIGYRYYKGQPTQWVRELDGLRRSWLPFSNNWLFGMAANRAFWDPMWQELDPYYVQKIQRERQNFEKKGGTWAWQPGSTSPDRLPDLSKILNVGAED